MENENGISNVDNTDCSEAVQCRKSEAVNNGVAVRNDVNRGVQRLKSEAVNNGLVIANGNDVAEGDSGEVERFRTYKRRKHVKLSSESKAQEDCKTYMEASNHIGDQVDYGVLSKIVDTRVVKVSCNVAVGNSSDNYSHGHWGNVVLKHLYQSLGDDKSGIEGCMREALMRHSKISCATTVKETCKIDQNEQEHSLQFEGMSHTLQREVNGHANHLHNECSSESDGPNATEMCQRALCNILVSEKFSSLCKVLIENFKGMKPESVFDFSVINSRLKERAYEQSPTLFLSDIQQVWRKLQDTGNEIVSLAKGLSNMSRTFYCEQTGVLVDSTFKDGKQEVLQTFPINNTHDMFILEKLCPFSFVGTWNISTKCTSIHMVVFLERNIIMVFEIYFALLMSKQFCNRESDSHMKPEQTEDCSMHKICTCRHCGEKADGADCLVCDSCEEIYHVSCIEPAVKEIPYKSWYCAKCTASGIGSPHENCLVCERLNVPQTLNNLDFDEGFPINEEILHELEENSNCTYDGAQASRRGESNCNCKICGNEVDSERMKICFHSFCSNKYYHVRCLTSKQLKSYGPCWYCPSCLCQVCFTDRDDDQIVLCDGCDHAYHIYCMKPPRTSIPKGKWFCRKCDKGIQAIRQAKKAYESNKQKKTSQDESKPGDKLEKKWNNKHGRELEKGGGMDMLLTAANTLNFEENLATIHTQR
ncbi:PHD finger protein EHD3-like isoform X1 [Senna tora]|uniref:PHD finger protein EHD3-like isoform X1 n=1 Tax=Senna tora TaxID=362788 RepID=A0A834WEW4_9FABA|nr:PHD finger protein EHD3-like isoform X1 [Senna tora]